MILSSTDPVRFYPAQSVKPAHTSLCFRQSEDSKSHCLSYVCLCCTDVSRYTQRWKKCWPVRRAIILAAGDLVVVMIILCAIHTLPSDEQRTSSVIAFSSTHFGSDI
jgi:hypothetical protein